MKLLVDAQLPPVLVDWLRRQGHEAAHVAEWSLLAASDAEIWAWAAAGRYVIVTKDADFEGLSTTDREGPRLLWLRVGNIRNRGLISRLALEWPRIEQAFADGARVVEFW